MREVVEIASFGRVVGGVGHSNIAASVAMWLLDAQGRRPDLVGILKSVAHVVEENKAQVGTDPTEGGRRSTEFQGIDEHAGAANRISGLGIARSGGIDRKAAMGGGAAGIKPLG